MSAGVVDALVIGGGFFGCSIALWLKRKFGSVQLVEQEKGLFAHASYGNQARIHNGYHYPRSLQTAYRSHVNFQNFLRDFPDCVVSDFTKLYCIAGGATKVTPTQFRRFCEVVGVPLKPARGEYARLFHPTRIEAVYETQEYAFNSNILREMMRAKLDRTGVEVRLETRVSEVDASGTPIRIALSGGSVINARYLFNCTYAGLKHIPGLRDHCRTKIKLEMTEMALIEPPEELRDVGVTVMCGPFFSVMPFPPRSLHTLSHVRYTPHYSWNEDESPCDPYEILKAEKPESRAIHMIKDSSRYLPAMARARVVDSMFQIKTLLIRNEIDDGRPILIERSDSRRVYSILGGKIDNIYDVIERLESEGL